ncbi:MAG: DUF3147 family protein [Hyphomicrobiaceae bacterium]|nr:DUF3147 family protein [Hyphomicrobiaceae bacterium]
MTQLLVKAFLSGLIIAVVSEIATRSPGIGALIASLPLVSILAMVWLWRDTGDAGRVGSYSEATFWLVIPSLPMFLVLPWLLRQGLGFWPALGLSCLVTVGLYALSVRLLPALGIDL